jgi:hypothetical protein
VECGLAFPIGCFQTGTLMYNEEMEKQQITLLSNVEVRSKTLFPQAEPHPLN